MTLRRALLLTVTWFVSQVGEMMFSFYLEFSQVLYDVTKAQLALSNAYN